MFINQQLKSTLKRLKHGWQCFKGWRDVIDGDEITKDKLTEKMIFDIRMKCKYLSFTLNAIIQSYCSSTLTSIINNVCIYIFDYEFIDKLEYDEKDNNKQMSSALIQKWLRSFICNEYYMHNPIIIIHSKARIPPILSDNPELYSGF
jgi:hypothetical protein